MVRDFYLALILGSVVEDVEVGASREAVMLGFGCGRSEVVVDVREAVYCQPCRSTMIRVVVLTASLNSSPPALLA